MSDHRARPAASAAGEQSLPDLFGELWALIKDYVRQETVDPIKGVGRYVAFGVLGALLIGTGVVLLAVGGLRVLQDEATSAFDGNFTWAPYLIVFVALVVGGAVSLGAATSRRSRSKD